MRIADAPIRTQLTEEDHTLFVHRVWAQWFRQVLDFIRPKLTKDSTYYVRTDGNDKNTGLENHPQRAFQTLQKAIDTAALLDTRGWEVTIRLADGTYDAGGLIGPEVGGGGITLEGNVDDPSACVLSVAAGHCIEARGRLSHAKITVKGMKLEAAAGSAIRVENASLDFEAVQFGTCGDYHVHAAKGGIVSSTGDYQIVGGAKAHWLAETFGQLALPSAAVTVQLEDDPAFSLAFALARDLGLVQCGSGFTFDGDATGKRYDATGNSVIDTAGMAADYLPGDSAGTTASGGQYL